MISRRIHQRQAAIRALVDSQGKSVGDLAENAVTENTGPGICVECASVFPAVRADEVEDCRDCGSAGTVRGILVLMGVV